MNQPLITFNKSVELKPYVERPRLNYEMMTDNELWNGAGGTLILDTETYLNYHLVAFKDVKTKKVVKLEFPYNQRKLAWIMQAYRTIGFNTIKYDLPIIWYGHKYQDLAGINKLSRDIIFTNAFPKQLEKDYDFTIFPTSHIDLIEVCPLRGSLKLYGARLHAPRIQDLPFSVNEPLSSEAISVVSDYCVNDLNTTELLYNNLTEQLALREQLTIEYKQNVMSKSDAQIAETVISSELKRLTGKWPSKPKIDGEYKFKFIVPSNMFFQTNYMKKVLANIANADFSLDEYGRLNRNENIKDLKIRIGNGIYRMGIGGLHSSEECTAYKSNDEYQIYDRDVASFYPEIVRKLKLYPQHLGEDFLTVYDEIVNRRLAAKAAKRIAESENLKVTINGTFGKTGSPYSVLYAPQMTIQITVGGQLYLLMLIEALEFVGIKIISANTDGVMIYCHKDQREHMLHIITWWEQTTGFVTEETKYEAVYSRDVNAYMAIENKNKVKGKNIFYDPWRGKSAKDRYWRFQKNPQCQICVEAVEQLITKAIPVEQTIKECKDFTKFVAIKNVTGGAHKNNEYLGKVVRWAYCLGETETINYIESNRIVPDTLGARPFMDLPEMFPSDINYAWYIKRVNTMLEDLAFVKKKQLTFF